jgi:hypothetical protein
VKGWRWTVQLVAILKAELGEHRLMRFRDHPRITNHVSTIVKLPALARII